LARENKVLAESLPEWKEGVGMAYRSILSGIKPYRSQMEFRERKLFSNKYIILIDN
jgi:hypothetical protein